MAYYKAEDIIRLTRMALGISQEELSFDICSTLTLSRIENGKCRVKEEKYHRLMDRMGRFSEKKYAICTSKEMEILQEKILFEDAVTKFHYKKAREYFKLLEHKVSKNILNEQYIERARALLEYYEKKLSAEQLIIRLEEILKLTVKNYENYLNKVYPYTQEEILILMNIANRYYHIKNVDKCIKIYEMLDRCLNLDYIQGTEKYKSIILLKRSIASIYGNIGEYEKSNQLAKEALKLAVEYDYGYMISVILEDLSWNYRKMNKKMKDESIKEIMRQAYYIAAARKDDKVKNIILNSYKKSYNESIIL